MKDIKLYDSSINLLLYKMQKNFDFSKDKKSKSMTNISIKKLLFPLLEGNEKELEKLSYLNERLGLNLSIKDADKFKIILNFKEFFVYNKITTYTEDPVILQKLNKYAIGFLSYDCSNIIFRSIVDKSISGFRYHVYNIFGNYETSKRFYTIGNKVDLLSKEINIITTEGIIDLIGVYNHFYSDIKDQSNYLFAAINGKGYNLVFQYLARLGFLDVNLNIYSDSDVNLNFYKSIKNSNEFLSNQKIKVFYNKINKDYGVKKDEIDLSYTII